MVTGPTHGLGAGKARRRLISIFASLEIGSLKNLRRRGRSSTTRWLVAPKL